MSDAGKVQLAKVGFFTRWQVEGVKSATASIPPVDPASEEAGVVESEERTEERRAETRKREVYIRACTDAELHLPLQVKAVKLEGCERCNVHLPRGAVASIELLRCKRLVLRLGGPVAAVRIDDCADVSMDLEWAAKQGFPDGSRGVVGGSSSSSTSTSGGGAGFHVYSTGSHSLRVSFPLSPAPDARRVERLLPDTLHSVLGGEDDRPETSVVDARSPWGVAGPARPPAAAAAATASAAATAAASSSASASASAGTAAVSTAVSSPAAEDARELTEVEFVAVAPSVASSSSSLSSGEATVTAASGSSGSISQDPQ